MVEANITESIKQSVEERWNSQYIPALEEFIRVPNLTVFCDPEFLTNGLIQEAKSVVSRFAQALEIEGLSEHVVEEEGRRSELLFVSLEAGTSTLPMPQEVIVAAAAAVVAVVEEIELGSGSV